jgi:predicted component of type VI protein secretion system
VLGRVTGCDLVIDDGKCSRRHARICVEGSVVEIEDLQSSNGTLLNGKPVQRRMLRDGDQIQIGKTVIVYREGVIATKPVEAPKPAAAPKVAPPQPARPSAAPAAAGDDDDLFGDAPAKPAASAPLPKPAPATAADDDDLFGDAPAPAAKPQAVPPPAPARPSSPIPSAPPPRPSQVVEFADEVVQVRATPQAKPAAAPAASAASGEPKIESRQRVLQFQQHSAGRGPLSDDLAQMSAGTKALLFIAVLAGAAGLVWLMIWLVR